MDLATEILTQPDDKEHAFANYISKKFGEIENSRQKTIAEKLINDVLFEASMGNLSITSRISSEKALATSYYEPMMTSAILRSTSSNLNPPMQYNEFQGFNYN